MIVLYEIIVLRSASTC